MMNGWIMRFYILKKILNENSRNHKNNLWGKQKTKKAKQGRKLINIDV